MSKPLTWNDEQIRTFVNANAFKVFRDGDIRRVVGVASADAVAMMIRDDLQRRIVELEAHVNSIFGDNLDDLTENQLERYAQLSPPEMFRAMLKLEAQLARTYVPVDYLINDSLEEIYADEIAITIGYDNTAMATFAWPEKGKYAVCRLAGEADNATL